MSTHGRFSTDTPEGQATLVAALKMRDREAFVALVRAYTGWVWQLAFRILKDEQHAEEVVQTVFLAAWEKIDDLNAQGVGLTSWIRRVAVNAALMRLRSASRRREDLVESPGDLLPAFTDDGHWAESVPEWSRPAEELIGAREVIEAVEAAVEELPEGERAVFILREVEHLSTKEVADSLGLQEGAVRTRLHRARLFLRKRLADVVDGGARDGNDVRASVDEGEGSATRRPGRVTVGEVQP